LREAYGVVRAQPRFLAWPLVALGSTLALWTGVGVVVALVPPSSEGVQSSVVVTSVVGLLVVLIATRVLWCWCNVAVTYAMSAALRGESIPLAGALSMALLRWKKILAWVAFSATIGVVLRILSSALSGILGRIVQEVSVFAWAAATYYVVPVLAFEELSVVDSLKRSGTLLAKFPRVMIGSNVALQIVTALGLLAPMVIASSAVRYLGTHASTSWMVNTAVGTVGVLAVMIFFALAIALSALQSAVRVLLYHSTRTLA
jgi:hypothetical protein